MENQNMDLFSLRFDDTAKSHIKSTVSWVMIIVICSVIGYVLSIIQLMKPAPKLIFSEGESFRVPSSGGQNMSSVIIGLVIGILLTWLLYNFARYAKKGVEGSSSADLNKGFMSLKNYFLVISILIIIMILFFLLAILAAGAMG
jgi:small-conductance mechanosensitive channel